MNALTTNMAKALGKPSFRDAWKAGGWKLLIDGTLGEAMVVQGPVGTLVGEDYNGNKYFENKDAQWVRNRWVVYKGAEEHWRLQDSSTVPPEWHGWLHYITDDCPANATFPKPVYGVEAGAHPTMSPAAYKPKGVWSNSEERHWQRYAAWDPKARA